MQSININQLKNQYITQTDTEAVDDKLSIDEIKKVEEVLHQLFEKNVSQIHLKSKWTVNQISNGYPNIHCIFTKESMHMKQSKLPTDPIIEYKYLIKLDELTKNNNLIKGKEKSVFFKHLVKVIEWFEADKLIVDFK